MRNPSLDQMQERTLALTVDCPDCKRPVNVPCGYRDYLGEWHELEAFPAHLKRSKAAWANRKNA